MRRAACLLAALAAFATDAARAETHRLDDALTHTVPPNVQMQWRPLQAGADGSGAVEAWVQVNVRLDTRAFVQRSGRVYLALERDQASPVEAVWSSQGRLQAGRVVSGERTLVFAGVIPGATLDDQLNMRLRAQADWPSTQRRLNFHFEFDAD
ncbi:MAG: hypothetical protein GTN84_01095 [Hydrogenophaga sp.]|uniref:hypothetical protein n=1 Tax=Hydrogenophaga sp. TaxID=1904254 RepID=UPI0016AF22BE|nr:hypothetical protein [Hydrogenophaga sp.]NIM39748.1 hypothetical protein [Hydrogenophaga sp.]NIN24952.1 hypothetical protein [Hydrogenophaga sp.]NIN29464.1 hypothetical protein [Hydrogenophaga sp.]NIN53987.1 hypothetical protein [Hydrogenophaga sp.]NIO50191.1 hypothetical protein [Hydrogenophaga sp.]